MKKAILQPFLLPTGLMLMVILACNLNFVAPQAPETPILPAFTLPPTGIILVSTSTDSPTLPPTETPTHTPTHTSVPPTFTPTTDFIIILPILPVIALVPSDTPIAPKLNFSQPPNYGNSSLISGFVPDPFQMGMTAGGDVDVSYISSGCSGFATSAPDLRLNYSAGGAAVLRIYFIGGQDTTLVINTPGGSYFCVDDSFGTLNPTIDFNNPVGGSYDIWVGSYSSGAFVAGTLSITEVTANHP